MPASGSISPFLILANCASPSLLVFFLNLNKNIYKEITPGNYVSFWLNFIFYSQIFLLQVDINVEVWKNLVIYIYFLFNYLAFARLRLKHVASHNVNQPGALAVVEVRHLKRFALGSKRFAETWASLDLYLTVCNITKYSSFNTPNGIPVIYYSCSNNQQGYVSFSSDRSLHDLICLY